MFAITSADAVVVLKLSVMVSGQWKAPVQKDVSSLSEVRGWRGIVLKLSRIPLTTPTVVREGRGCRYVDDDSPTVED